MMTNAASDENGEGYVNAVLGVLRLPAGRRVTLVAGEAGPWIRLVQIRLPYPPQLHAIRHD